MTERFEVPDPSSKAMEAFSDYEGYSTRQQVHAAMQADVPAIVRAEVEAALREVANDRERDITWGHEAVNYYLSTRYGEPTPEKPEGPAITVNYCPDCQWINGHAPTCRPEGAPEPWKTDTLPPLDLTSNDILRSILITPAERALLRALARERIERADDYGPERLARAESESVAAARSLLSSESL